MSRPERILVTGAAGFIGSTLTEQLLDEGRRVVGFDSFDDFYAEEEKLRNLEAASRRAEFRLVRGDIRDAAAVSKALAEHRIDGVVHLAALAGVRPSLERPALYADVNVNGTSVVLEQSVRHGSPKVVMASSSSVYGERSDGPFREDDRVDRPISPYAATKKACELVAHGFHHAHGIGVVCARIFTAYGPRQRPDLAIRKFADRMRRGESIPVFGDGSAQRDFTYVSDLVAGLVAALDAEPAFRVLNFGGGRTVSVLEMIRTLERELAVSARIDWLPRQTGDVTKTWADISLARETLGYSPATPFEEGIARFAAWLRSVR
ncbi:UDP-glucuronate 4-epimerase [Myxococcaceae bacterium]|jgi:UDP-glucuronate 4-epimerase|nr:UDP-glucuronate 4-epimerase [Myxococcaceae bacterium]